MRTTVLLWIAAFILTAASAIYQRVTGPSYPLRGSVTLGGTNIPYRLDRTHAGTTDHHLVFPTGDGAIHGRLVWKRYKTSDPWTAVPMTRSGDTLSADLPNQPPAGKLLYRIELERGSESAIVPRDEPVVIRFKGDVPLAILIIHVTLMFTGMLFSTRALLECFKKEARLKLLSWGSLLLLAGGGLILGPIVQQYAFGALWTGWPVGPDLTDNKTALIVISWLIAVLAVRKARRAKLWVSIAAVITLLVYLIPHSVLGSELDYNAAKPPGQTVNTTP